MDTLAETIQKRRWRGGWDTFAACPPTPSPEPSDGHPRARETGGTQRRHGGALWRRTSGRKD